jgi:hypothetical protein
VLTPLSRFCQVRPEFEHVDKERAARTIKTKEQINSEKAAAAKVTRVLQNNANE